MRFLATLAFVILSGVVSNTGTAQSLEVPNPITVGSSITISYADPGRAGTTIEVEMDNGTKTETVKIKLDTNGQGSATWTVPDWEVVFFNAPGATEVTRFPRPGGVFAAHSVDAGRAIRCKQATSLA